MSTVALSIGLTEPIGEWATLVETIKEWTNRSDWSNQQVTEFIAICEARLNRVLRHPEMETIADSTLVAGNNDLPADFLAMRMLTAGECKLSAVSPSTLISAYGNVVGTPLVYTIISGNPRKIRLAPQPETDVAVSMVYYARLEGVSENNSENWLLNEHPDIYLYGTLLAAEAFLANDERLPLWKSAYDEALAELDRAGNLDRFGPDIARPGPVRQMRGARA